MAKVQLREQKRILGPRHHDVATTLLNIVSALREKGLYNEVLPRYKETLVLREEALAQIDPGDPDRRQLLSDVAESLYNMGAAYMDLGRHREASPHLERALTIYEEDLNEVRHIRYAGIAMMLGSALRAQKDYQQSRERLEAALDVHREVVDEEHQDTAKNLMNLGALLREQADEDKQLSDAERGEALASARGYLEKALTLSEGLYGDDHPITGGVLRELADLARAEDRPEVERSYQERAEAICEKFLGSVEADTADELDQGARSLSARGLFDEAMRYQRHSLRLRTDAFGEESLQTATALLDLARLLQLQGSGEKARSYLRKALAIYEGILGEGDPVTELVRENLAALGAPPR